MNPKAEPNELITIKQYLTDEKGQKIAAIIDMEELKKIKDLIEDLSDLKAIEDRKNEPDEDYEAYSREKNSRLNV